MHRIKLFVFDIDNTITFDETIWERMHQGCGTWESHGLKFLEQYKNGEIDFDEFARRDVITWQNLPEEILKTAIKKVKITPGFQELINYLKEKNIATAIVSCSIKQFADYLAQKYGIDYVYANEAEIKKKKLTGNIKLTVGGNQKEKSLLALIKKLKLQKEEIAVIGDSEFDIPMLNHTPHSFIIRNEKFKNQANYFIKDFFDVLKLLQTT